MSNTRIFKMTFASVYPHYVAKVEKKGRSRAELHAVMPHPHPNAAQITGLICGYRVEEIADPLLRQIRQLDKLVDELAKGKSLAKILRD